MRSKQTIPYSPKVLLYCFSFRSKSSFCCINPSPTRFINTPSIPSKSINSQNYLRPSRIGSRREDSMLGIHLKKSQGSLELRLPHFPSLFSCSWDASATRVILTKSDFWHLIHLFCSRMQRSSNKRNFLCIK